MELLFNYKFFYFLAAFVDCNDEREYFVSPKIKVEESV